MRAFDTRLKTQRYTVASRKITGSVRLVLLTDLHSCFYGDGQKELIEAVDRQSPALVLLGGDICDDKRPRDNTERFLRGIAHRYPCYYVTGNHEYRRPDVDAILDMFASYGVVTLDGACDTLCLSGTHLNLCGISDPTAVRAVPGAPGMQRQLAALRPVMENGYFTLLLAHRPERIRAYAQCGFDLVLSGHAHGGQWRWPGVINGLYAPNQGLFPRYAGGLYTVGGTTMIVSRGLARETTRVPRIFNPPELVVVELTGAD